MLEIYKVCFLNPSRLVDEQQEHKPKNQSTPGAYL